MRGEAEVLDLVTSHDINCRIQVLYRRDTMDLQLVSRDNENQDPSEGVRRNQNRIDIIVFSGDMDDTVRDTQGIAVLGEGSHYVEYLISVILVGRILILSLLLLMSFWSRFAMSSDNASSAVTYTSVSSDSNGPSSWGIPLVNAGELSEMDPYEVVVQQGQAHPLSPAYVFDLMELDEHVPVYVPEPKHPEYHAPSDDDIQVEDQPYADDASPTTDSPGYIADSDSIEEDADADSINYPDEPEDGEEDDDEDPEEDPKEDPSEEHEPEDDDDDDDTNDEDKEPIKDEEEEEHLALADSSVVHVVDLIPSAGDTEAFETNEAQKTVRLEPPMLPPMEARIAEHASVPIPPTNPTYDQAPLGHRAAMIRIRDDIPEKDMPPQRRFVLTAPPTWV
ncbi:hypothetical protein Tco_0577918 [Tanacetum coccineum]